MRYAVIDVGTNSVKLLVADCQGGELKSLLEDSKTTRLGQDVAKNRRLLSEAIERTVDVVSEFVERAKSLHPQQFLAYATSAVRDSSNRDEFLRRFLETADFDCQVITGELEAELIFRGATSHAKHGDRDVVVFDIGGGSVEFIRGRAGQIHYKTSLNCGAVRLTESFLHSDPPTQAELTAMTLSLGNSLKRLNDLITTSNYDFVILGTGGTISTLAAMQLGLDRPFPDRIDGHRFSLEQLRSLAETLSRTPLEQRKRLRGLSPQRADIIVAGAMTLVAGIEALHQHEIIVSARNLRHGAVLKHAGN